MIQSLHSPSAAHFETLARSRPLGHSDDLYNSLPQSIDRLLDAGCASGRVTLQLSGRARFAVGIDLSYDLIALAQKLGRDQGITNVAWVVGDMEHLPFRAESYSIVVSKHAIRLTTVQIALTELARLVKPGGQLSIQDVLDVAYPHRPAWFLYATRTLKGVPRYLRFFGPLMLLRILAYRFSPTELKRTWYIAGLTLSALQPIFDRVTPGAKLKPIHWGYLAVWQKPLDKMIRT